jgi:thiol-disulfide isomerase/thioredoxin
LPKPPPLPTSGNNQRRRENTAQAPPGPTGWSLLDNRRMRLSDHAGKVVVLDFWATYCPPCVAEAPHLVGLQRKYGKDGLVVVGLNVGGPDDRPQIPAFVEQTGVQYDLGIPDNALVDSLMGSDDSIPQTFIFDRQGKLVKSFVGFTPETAPEIEQAIQAALGAKP